MVQIKQTFFFFLLTFLLQSCFKGKSVDLIVHNAVIHTMQDNGILYEAMAIKDGEIVEIGPDRQILNKYTSTEE